MGHSVPPPAPTFFVLSPFGGEDQRRLLLHRDLMWIFILDTRISRGLNVPHDVSLQLQLYFLVLFVYYSIFFFFHFFMLFSDVLSLLFCMYFLHHSLSCIFLHYFALFTFLLYFHFFEFFFSFYALMRLFLQLNGDYFHLGIYTRYILCFYYTQSM